MRGILAEFLVASALDRAGAARVEWDSFDVTTDRGTKIEVKSASPWQTWAQGQPSAIRFGIRPTRAWNAETGKYDGVRRRQADVYVFALLDVESKNELDPLNLDQWTFYVLAKRVLDDRVPTQKEITVGGLMQLGAAECGYAELAGVVEQMSGGLQAL